VTALSLVAVLGVPCGALLTNPDHRQFWCDEAGDLSGIRIAFMLDFHLCRENHGENYCMNCKCEWLRYWEATSACFEQDEQLEVRLKRSLEAYTIDYSVNCLGTDIDEIEPLPTFSLDEDSANYCNQAPVHKWPMLGMLLLFQLLSLP